MYRALSPREKASASPYPDEAPSAAHSPVQGPENLNVVAESNKPPTTSLPAEGAAPLALIACRICQEPIRRSVSSIRADACCHICYTGLWRDAIRVAATLKRHRLLAVPGTSMSSVLDLFKQEMTQVGKPCVRTDGSCAPADYHYSTPRIRRCTRCRTKAAIELFPEVAYRLLSKAHQSLLKAEHNRRKSADADSTGSDEAPHVRPRLETPASASAAPAARSHTHALAHGAPSYGVLPGNTDASERLMRVPAMVPMGYAQSPAGAAGATGPEAMYGGMGGMMPGYWPMPWQMSAQMSAAAAMAYGCMPFGAPSHPMSSYLPGASPTNPTGSTTPSAGLPWPMMFMPPNAFAPGATRAPVPAPSSAPPAPHTQ